MERLRVNNGRYQGERIDMHQLLAEVERLAAATGWEADPIRVNEQKALPAYRRGTVSTDKQIYISTGIHGDEPAGPLAVLRLFKENTWMEALGLWIIPCLNPAGFILNRRENEAGVDLNRDYRSLKTDLVRAHVEWLQQRPQFALTLLLHEDWEAKGFYLYELNPERRPSLAEAIIGKVKQVCPIDPSPVIEGRAARNGIICANPDLDQRPDWPEAFYLIRHKTPLSYTLEGPSDFPLATRVNALAAAVRAVFEALEKEPVA